MSGDAQTSTQAWKLIELDYSLRLYLVAGELATEHLKKWNAVFAEARKRGNAGFYGPALVEMEIADADKRAEWSYQTCCEIWDIQGRTKCRPFFRAIFDLCLQPMFSVREGCFRHELELRHKRTGAGLPQDLSAIKVHMNREMGKLRAKWSTKLEIASRDAENEERIKHQQKLEEEGRLIRELRERSLYQQAFGTRQSYDMAHGTPESAGSPFPQSSVITDRPSQPRLPRGKTRKTRKQLKRMGVIFGAIQSELKGTK